MFNNKGSEIGLYGFKIYLHSFCVMLNKLLNLSEPP